MVGEPGPEKQGITPRSFQHIFSDIALAQEEQVHLFCVVYFFFNS